MTEARGFTVTTREWIEFGSLRIEFDHRVLRPRAWTTAQSYWAAEIASSVPEGEVLELCSGAGQIGLLSMHQSPRRLICVDAEPAAVELIESNARAAGMADRVQTRLGRVRDVLDPGELFPLILADPPWVPSQRVVQFPEDPVLAIDGGDEGLDVALECVDAIGLHLSPDGVAVLQLGTNSQVEALGDRLDAAGLMARETRTYGEHGVLVRLVRLTR